MANMRHHYSIATSFIIAYVVITMTDGNELYGRIAGKYVYALFCNMMKFFHTCVYIHTYVGVVPYDFVYILPLRKKLVV